MIGMCGKKGARPSPPLLPSNEGNWEGGKRRLRRRLPPTLLPSACHWLLKRVLPCFCAPRREQLISKLHATRRPGPRGHSAGPCLKDNNHHKTCDPWADSDRPGRWPRGNSQSPAPHTGSLVGASPFLEERLCHTTELESGHGGFPEDNISDIIWRELTRTKTSPTPTAPSDTRPWPMHVIAPCLLYTSPSPRD